MPEGRVINSSCPGKGKLTGFRRGGYRAICTAVVDAFGHISSAMMSHSRGLSSGGDDRKGDQTTIKNGCSHTSCGHAGRDVARRSSACARLPRLKLIARTDSTTQGTGSGNQYRSRVGALSPWTAAQVTAVLTGCP